LEKHNATNDQESGLPSINKDWKGDKATLDDLTKECYVCPKCHAFAVVKAGTVDEKKIAAEMMNNVPKTYTDAECRFFPASKVVCTGVLFFRGNATHTWKWNFAVDELEGKKDDNPETQGPNKRSGGISHQMKCSTCGAPFIEIKPRPKCEPVATAMGGDEGELDQDNMPLMLNTFMCTCGTCNNTIWVPCGIMSPDQLEPMINKYIEYAVADAAFRLQTGAEDS